MLDNFYIVKQTFRQVEEDLPASFLNQLPKLNGTPLKGHTRIFALAREWIGYSQGQIELTQAATFVQNYQQVTPLTIGELWAVPTMLRIGILERLVYAAAELTGAKAPKSLSPISLPALAFSDNAGTKADSLEPGLLRPVLEPELLRETPDQFASHALENEAIVANCFLSLRLLSATDWKAFLSAPAGWNRFCATTPQGSMRAWISTPATVIVVLSRNWHPTQISAKSKSRSP